MDLCDGDRVGPQLMDEIYRLLEEQLRRNCPLDPRLPWPRPDPLWCYRHPQVCHRINCLLNQDSPLCRTYRLPEWLTLPAPEPPPVLPRDPGPVDCNRILAEFNAMRDIYWDATDIYARLLELSAPLLLPLPHVPPTCTSSPACAGLSTLRNALEIDLRRWSTAPRGASLGRPLASVRGYTSLLSGLLAPCELGSTPSDMMGDALRRTGCSDSFNTSLWLAAGGLMNTMINDVRIYLEGLAENANRVLRSVAGELSSIGCRSPDPLHPVP